MVWYYLDTLFCKTLQKSNVYIHSLAYSEQSKYITPQLKTHEYQFTKSVSAIHHLGGVFETLGTILATRSISFELALHT